jgi:chaperone required for assembly of F1-ATPase
MRDILGGDFTPEMSDPDPVRRAQIQMKKPLPKRFYKDVTVSEAAGSFAILLDGRGIKTPARNALVAPTAAMADLVAGEWAGQGEFIDPGSMPITRLANTAIDGIAKDPEAVFQDVLKFSTSDLLCYRADAPEGLVARQQAAWDPLIEWLAADVGARFILIEGIIHQQQPAAAIEAFSARLRKYDSPMQLACLHTMTSLMGSAMLTLALAESRVSLEEAWALAHVDEDWTIEHWGSDFEAEHRRAARWTEMQAAGRAFFALQA